MKIKGAKTIEQYKILQWVQTQFEEDSVTIIFMDAESAIVRDRYGGNMIVRFNKNKKKIEVV